MFLPGTAVLLHSLKKNVALYDQCDVTVFYNTLSDKSKGVFRAIDPKVRFKTPHDTDFCSGANTIYGRGNQDCYLSFEAFRQSNYQKSIYMDADMLCIADVSEAIQLKSDFACCLRKTKRRGVPLIQTNHVAKVIYKANLQNAFMVMSGEHVTAYKLLIKCARKVRNNPMCDQAAQSLYLRNKTIHVLPTTYNFQFWGGGAGESKFDEYASDIKIIHYSGRRKPWGSDWSGKDTDRCCIRFPKHMAGNKAVDLWHKYYKECQTEYSIFND